MTYLKVGQSFLIVYYVLIFGAVGSLLLVVALSLGIVFVIHAVFGHAVVCIFVLYRALFVAQGVCRSYHQEDSDHSRTLATELIFQSKCSILIIL